MNGQPLPPTEPAGPTSGCPVTLGPTAPAPGCPVTLDTTTPAPGSPVPAGPTGPAPGAAVEFAIAGWSRLSTVDWPGKLAAVLFAQGCPWRCVYCHNADILDPRTPGRVPWQEVADFLRRRRGLLDAVVFSGGEPTRQACLAACMEQVRDLGFAVGMHTGGAYPKRLGQLLDAELVDWVGLDIKALPGDYQQVVGVPNAGERAWESLDLLLAHTAHHPHFDYEVRLTTYPTFPGVEEAVARALHTRGVQHFVLQRARGRSPLSGQNFDLPSWEKDFAQRAQRVRKTDGLMVQVRS